MKTVNVIRYVLIILRILSRKSQAMLNRFIFLLKHIGMPLPDDISLKVWPHSSDLVPAVGTYQNMIRESCLWIHAAIYLGSGQLVFCFTEQFEDSLNVNILSFKI